MRVIQAAATPRGPITIIHDAVPEDVATRAISTGLCSIIRNESLRRRIYEGSAADTESRLTVAVSDGTIVGRAVVAPSFGRWRALPRLREFAIEVAREWRHAGLAGRLTRTALSDPAVEDDIVVAFTLPSAWDIEHKRLSRAEYGRRLVAAAGRYGFRPVATDEPEVAHQFAAALLVRPGKQVPAGALLAFDRARFANLGARAAAA